MRESVAVMKTDDLIAALAKGEEKPPKTTRPWALGLALGALGALLFFLSMVGPRPDLGVSVWPTLAKAGFSAIFAVVAMSLVVRLARPGSPARRRVLLLLGVFAVSAVAALVAFIGTDPGARIAAWTGGGFPWCLVLIPLLASPAALALGWVARSFAPTDLPLSGAAVGAASGGIGAMAYAMRCPVDNVAFVATWYALAIALCAIVGALVGSRFLRW